MKIIIKPLGAIVLLGAILLLAILAYRGQNRSASTKDMSSPAAISSTSPDTAPEGITAPSVSPSPVASPASFATATAARGQSIYRDGVENGWVSLGWNWAKDVDLADKSRPRSGTRAIRVRYESFDGVKFHHAPLNTAPYDRISFYVNGGDKGSQHIGIGAARSEKSVADLRLRGSRRFVDRARGSCVAS